MLLNFLQGVLARSFELILLHVPFILSNSSNEAKHSIVKKNLRFPHKISFFCSDLQISLTLVCHKKGPQLFFILNGPPFIHVFIWFVDCSNGETNYCSGMYPNLVE